MDQTVIDLTDLPEARPGDEVEIVSPDAEAPNSVEHPGPFGRHDSLRNHLWVRQPHPARPIDVVTGQNAVAAIAWA